MGNWRLKRNYKPCWMRWRINVLTDWCCVLLPETITSTTKWRHLARQVTSPAFNLRLPPRDPELLRQQQFKLLAIVDLQISVTLQAHWRHFSHHLPGNVRTFQFDLLVHLPLPWRKWRRVKKKTKTKKKQKWRPAAAGQEEERNLLSFPFFHRVSFQPSIALFFCYVKDIHLPMSRSTKMSELKKKVVLRRKTNWNKQMV